jgi:SAM-dependent methyltransferase
VPGISASPEACSTCGSRDLTRFVATRQLALHRCRACEGLTAFPRPTPHALIAHHDSEEYFSHPYFERRREDLEGADARSRDVFDRVRAALPDFSPRGRRHLDVGCDTGVFLEAFARRYGTLPIGVDVSARAVEMARARGIEAYAADLANASREIGDCAVITVIDVIEHVADPIQLLREVRARLGAGGVCYIETPNIQSLVYGVGRSLSNLTGGRPAWLCERLFLPEHVQYLSAEGFKHAARAAGLRLLTLTHRSLGAEDVNVAAPVKLAVQSIQAIDRLLGREILHCAVLTV